METVAGLQRKEVIDIKDGTRLGFVYDVEIDLKTGRITGIRVPGASKVFGIFGKAEDFVISWEKIKKIGDDIILIDEG